MVRFAGFDPSDPLAGMVILGLLFPALAWLATRGRGPELVPVREPVRESLLLGGYFLFLTTVVTWGFGWTGRIAAEPAHSLVMLGVKLAAFVALPALLMRRAGGYCFLQLAPVNLKARALRPAMWMMLAALAMQAELGQGLRSLAAAGLPPWVMAAATPLCFLWLVVEVGVVEEFFFRVLLQERLTALFRSRWAGLLAASVLFGLMHAPGMYLRPGATQEALGAHPSLLFAMGYSVVVTSVAGIFLGVLWMRTRNFAVVIAVHAAADLIPNLLPWMRAFFPH